MLESILKICINTGINADVTLEDARTECEDRARILKQNSQKCKNKPLNIERSPPTKLAAIFVGFEKCSLPYSLLLDNSTFKTTTLHFQKNVFATIFENYSFFDN